MKTTKAPTVSATDARPASKATSLILVLGIHLAGLTVHATAAPGDVDPDFGTGGRVVFDQGGTERWDKILPLSNGDLIVSGTTGSAPVPTQYHMVRLNSKGELVPSFGNQGQITLSLGSLPGTSSGTGTFRNVFAQHGGKLLAVVSRSYTLNGVTSLRVSLVRVLSNGSPDATYGGDGIVEVDIPQSKMRQITAVAVDP
jgi:hypothetical protein